jgi:CheY-like chemotaxis protein
MGTTFRLLFPPTTSSAEVPVVKSHVTLHGGGVILVADDEDSVRKLTVVILQALGFQTIEAKDGQEAVEVAQRQGQEIRAALIDLMMPRLDGRQAVAEIRRLAPNLPVIIMSGYTEAEISGWFPGEIPVKFLQKPFTKDQMAERLAKVLQ